MIIEKLDHLTLLKITGNDAATFLQGQLTNDIELAFNQWQFSGYCTPKGRLLALLTIWRSKDSIFALIDNSILESTIKRLRMYVMRSKVTIEKVESHHYAILQPSYEDLISNDFFTEDVSTLNNHGFTTQENMHCLCYGDRLLAITTNSINSDIINNDSQHRWQKEDIKSGLPQINAATSELFIPQMLNLDVLNGVNFKKGCYTGQEIVARMHYLGKLKQRMFVCTLTQNNNEKSIQAGDKIYSDTNMKSSVGNIVSIDTDSALAVLRIDSIKESGQNTFILNETATLKVNDSQPYPLK